MLKKYLTKQKLKEIENVNNSPLNYQTRQLLAKELIINYLLEELEKKTFNLVEPKKFIKEIITRVGMKPEAKISTGKIKRTGRWFNKILDCQTKALCGTKSSSLCKISTPPSPGLTKNQPTTRSQES